MYSKPVYSDQCPSIRCEQNEIKAILSKIEKMATEKHNATNKPAQQFGKAFVLDVYILINGLYAEVYIHNNELYMINLARDNENIRHYTTL